MSGEGTIGGGSVTIGYMVERDADAAYVYLPNHPRTFRCVARTAQITPGVLLDLNAAGEVIGIEVISSDPCQHAAGWIVHRGSLYCAAGCGEVRKSDTYVQRCPSCAAFYATKRPIACPHCRAAATPGDE